MQLPPNFINYNIQEMLKLQNLSKIELSDKLAQILRPDAGKQMILVSGPNGVGKDTLVQYFFELWNGSSLSGSYFVDRFPRSTSREQRLGEIHGIDYFFETEEHMLDNSDDYVAMTRYPANDAVYGIDGTKLAKNVQDPNQHILCVAGIDFAPVLKTLFPEATSVYILPPSVTALEERLRHRNPDSSELHKRLEVGEEEMITVFASFFGRRCYFNGAIDRIIVNDNLEKAGKELYDHVASVVRRKDIRWQLPALIAQYTKVLEVPEYARIG